MGSTAKASPDSKKVKGKSKVFVDDHGGEVDGIFYINCSGIFFQIQKRTLCSVPGSLLNTMFSDEFVHRIPRRDYEHGGTKQTFLVLDFNPQCFGYIIDWLKNRQLTLASNANALTPLPPIPPEQKANMDVLCDTLRLHQFAPPNALCMMHQTSLIVQPYSVLASYTGWQVITAQYPLRLSAPSYFEVLVEANQDPRGGLAIGECTFTSKYL